MIRIEKNKSKLYPSFNFQLAIVSDVWSLIKARAIAEGFFVGEGPDHMGTIYGNSKLQLQEFVKVQPELTYVESEFEYVG